MGDFAIERRPGGKVTNDYAQQVKPSPGGKAAFGEALTAEPTIVEGLSFAYGINAVLVDTHANQSGSSANANSLAQCVTGAAANSSCALKSTKAIHYQPGMGVSVKFTGMFTTGVANSEQIIGVGDSGEGYFFGYNGTAFGVLRRQGGVPEIRTLTVTTGSSHAENITITLNGNATSVAVTNTADTTLTANEIAAGDYSDNGTGWTAKAVGAKVVFVSWEAASGYSGTYSLSAATSAVGTFAQTLAGADPTDTWVAQASWNGEDKFDGNGLTGVTLDATKINVFKIDFQYLGAGVIRFFIEEPASGDLHLVHSIQYANANTTPSLDNANLHLYIRAKNTSNTSSLTTSTASMAMYHQGKKSGIGIRRGLSGSLTLGATSNETPILTFRIKEVFGSVFNRSSLKINLISTSVEHTKPCAIKFYANQALTGASFSDLATATSAVEFDTSATASTGGTEFFAIDLGKTGNQVLDLKDDLYAAEFGPGTTITATLAPTSGNSAEGNVAFNITEKF